MLRALDGGDGRFLTVEFEGAAGFEALDRAQAEAAQAEILKQYGIAERQEPLGAAGRSAWPCWASCLRAGAGSRPPSPRARPSAPAS